MKKKQKKATTKQFKKNGHIHTFGFCAMWLYFLLFACSAPQKTRHEVIPQHAELPYPIEKVDFRIPLKTTFDDYLKVIAGGDIMIGHWTTSYIEKHGVEYPFEQIKSQLRDGDVVFGNLEAPFADSGKTEIEKKFTFKVPTRFAPGLKKAGFNVLSLANNHMLDFGISGLAQTLATLDSLGLQRAGAGLTLDEAWREGVLLTPAGSVAVLAFSMTFPQEFWATDSTGGTAYPELHRLEQTVKTLKKHYRFVIASFHWGREKYDEPRDYQIYFARRAIDFGVDLVLGHHPHVLQGIELYKNKLIAYSLGNLAFSSYSKSAVNSMLLRVYLKSNGDFLYGKIIPLNIDNSEIAFQPQLAGSLRTRAIFTHLDSLSFKLNQRDIITHDGLIFDVLPEIDIALE